MSDVTDSETDAVREKITKFLRRNFPQIQMHGGSAAITSLDLEERSVTLELGGACSGCGISPMTVQALKTRLPNDVDEIDVVHASTGAGFDSGQTASRGGRVSRGNGQTSNDVSDAPF